MTHEEEKKVVVVDKELEQGNKTQNGVPEEKEDRTEEDGAEAEDGDDSDDSEDDDDEGETSQEEDDEEPEKTPDELLVEGKSLLKESNFGDALSKFAWAVQLKCRELKEVQDHPDLALYYLNYGDALLVKEENSNELFDLTDDVPLENKEEKKAKTTTSASVDEDGSESQIRITDEQLAWETLELARVCYSQRLQKQESTKIETKDVEDASFVHIRLGDILTLQEKFAEAAKEYQTAISLRQKHQLPYTALQAATVSLAQAQLFSGQRHEALENFKKALKYIEDNLNGVGGLVVPDDKKKDFTMSVEDLQAQIDETEKAIAAANATAGVNGIPDGANHADGSNASTIPSRIKFLPPHNDTTTSTFDKPVLTGEAVVNLGIIGGCTKNDADPKGGEVKRRRVDISKYQVNLKDCPSH